MVRPVEPGAGELLGQPAEQALVPHVHADGYFGLKAVSTEMAFSDENAHEKAFFEIVHAMSLGAPCFTVKFPVKHPAGHGGSER
jgi:hypothetical protein